MFYTFRKLVGLSFHLLGLRSLKIYPLTSEKSDKPLLSLVVPVIYPLPSL